MIAHTLQEHDISSMFPYSGPAAECPPSLYRSDEHSYLLDGGRQPTYDKNSFLLSFENE